MKQFWNTRYDEAEYAYGTAPNVFFAQELQKLTPGKLLLPAEGEGRNAVFAAKLGWEVWAFDQSESGQNKALRLAQKEGVKLHYDIASAESVTYPEAHFDALGLVYAHFPPQFRQAWHRRFLAFLKPEGTVLLEGFHKTQLGKPSGGPKDAAMLFSEAELREDFEALSTLEVQKWEGTLHEGKYHEGEASVLQLVGKK